MHIGEHRDLRGFLTLCINAPEPTDLLVVVSVRIPRATSEPGARGSPPRSRRRRRKSPPLVARPRWNPTRRRMFRSVAGDSGDGGGWGRLSKKHAPTTSGPNPSVFAERWPCDASGLLQQADSACGLVSALYISQPKPGGRPPSPTETVSGLVPFLRDGVRDLSSAQKLADLPGRVRPGRSGRGRAGCVGCCDLHTSCHARSIVQQANRTISTTQRPCMTSTPQTRHRESPTGPHSAITSLFAYSSDRHSLGAWGLSTDPSECQGSAGGGETSAHRISRAARDGGRRGRRGRGCRD